MNFPTKLKKLREERKLKQQDVADKLGIARTTYASYEQGKREPDHATLVKIADFFGVSLDFLLRDVSEDFQDKFFKDEAKRILNDPKTFIAARDGEVTQEILDAALEIITEQLKEGRKKKSD
ncbi:helix-turn-helix domain-containing protein [Bacillus sp. FSL W8-0445]|uniref:helix-turn-helix domain-containing protein n=1 Tax=Bacillus TaxID=1386 RepID=UPI0007797489|nr:helix-turn-helix domain-containing protein [Bacillus licheniformis]KYC82627.1 hypothetical protein B4091_1471 [Bacillus licheniformis]OLF99958.1 transcriptional regulator Cro/CI family [Bacillus licheniformis]OLQ45170.1 XRE family transcriptional regulator [Bacillus licheniformis]TWK63212.1 HTH-type transcriptional regulator Xre [Bacillus licheniformis]